MISVHTSLTLFPHTLTVSQSIEPHESPYHFQVFPVCLKIPLLDLYMPLLLILQDSVYMVIQEPSGCFHSRSKSSLNPCDIFILPLIDRIICWYVFFSPLARYLMHSVHSIEWSNLSYSRLKTGCIAQRKELDWGRGRIWRAKESRRKLCAPGTNC